jgi:hypothetical protein
MLRRVNGVFAVTVALSLSSCGTVLWTETNEGPPRGEVDGAVLTYALADGELSVQGEIKSGVLTVTTDQKVVAKPDIKKIYHVIYSHSGFSDDDINIQLDGALVRSISSTTTDKTVQIIQGVTGLLTQVSATQVALAKAAKFQGLEPGAAPPTPPCADMQVTYIKNLTHDYGHPYVTKPGTADCEIRFDVSARIVSSEYLGVKAFARQSENNVEPEYVCREYAFCFRMGAIYEIRASAQAYKGKDPVSAKISIPPFKVAAPVVGHLGYVRFDRRAFVANKATLAFDTNGLVSSFAATNPSEVLGFLVVPTAVAAGIAAGAALHH